MTLYTILGVIHFILFIIAAFEIIASGKSLGAKVLWLLVILLLPIIGLIIYYLMGRSAKTI
ncbi:MAG: PLDc N-terminal domain-containing protein [Planctomycetota bacterium]|nr:PLDc N-terminal domain-containing protein [Planctomycetota bacterium]